MMARRTLLRWLDYLADLVVIVPGVWWMGVLIGQDGDPMIFLLVLYLMMAAAVVTPLWVYLRMMPRLLRLAGDLDWRQELAMTPLAAGRYLRRRLLRPLITSSFVLFPLAAMTIIAPFRFSTDGSVYAIFSLVAFFSFVGLAICLVVQAWIFLRLLRPGVAGSTRIGLAIGGFFVTGGMCIGLNLLFVYIAVQSGQPETIIALLLFFIGLGVLLFGLTLPLWRSCCRQFYTFDASPGDAAPPC